MIALPRSSTSTRRAPVMLALALALVAGCAADSDEPSAGSAGPVPVASSDSVSPTTDGATATEETGAVDASTSSPASTPTPSIEPVATTIPPPPEDIAAIVELYPLDPAVGGGLAAAGPDVVSAVDAVRTDGATPGCTSFTAAVERVPARAIDLLSDDPAVDATIRTLLGELQLSTASAVSACASGDTEAAAAALADVDTIVAAIDRRDEELG